MFVDARNLPSGETLTADICIIGAGAAGITLACDLANSSLSVALLESGGYSYEEATQELYDGPNVGQPTTPLMADRLRYLGGSTNHWSGGCRPFDAHDFWAWPFGRDTMDPYYERAQKICQLGKYNYKPEDWATPAARPMALPADAKFQSGVFQNSPPTRFGEVYRNTLATQGGLKVYLHANVVDIVTTDNAGAVTELAVATLDGKRMTMKARVYVLATGGVENARILLNCTKVAKAGLGNGYDKVGRYYMDHPFVSCVASLVWLGSGALSFYGSQNVVQGTPIQGYLTLKPEALAAAQMPSFAIGIQAGDIPDRGFWVKSAEEVFHAAAAGHIPDNLGFHVGRIAHGLEWEAENVYRKVFEPHSTLYSTNLIAECPPDPASRVYLTDKVDALGLRRVALDWKLPADFGANVTRAHEMLAQELGSAGLARMRLHTAATGYDPMASIDNGHHAMGTTRMANDPRQGVVDANCRLHGCGNLYVAGSSVYPSYSFDNPTLTIVALSLRLSEHLKTSVADAGRIVPANATAERTPAAAVAGDMK